MGKYIPYIASGGAFTFLIALAFGASLQVAASLTIAGFLVTCLILLHIVAIR